MKLGIEAELWRPEGVMLGGLIASGRNVVLAEDLIPGKNRQKI